MTSFYMNLGSVMRCVLFDGSIAWSTRWLDLLDSSIMARSAWWLDGLTIGGSIMAISAWLLNGLKLGGSIMANRREQYRLFDSDSFFEKRGLSWLRWLLEVTLCGDSVWSNFAAILLAVILFGGSDSCGGNSWRELFTITTLFGGGDSVCGDSLWWQLYLVAEILVATTLYDGNSI